VDKADNSHGRFITTSMYMRIAYKPSHKESQPPTQSEL